MPLLKFSHFAPAFELFGLGGIRVFFAFEPKAIPIHNGFLREQTLLGPDENVFTKSHFKRADADFGDRLALALTPEQLDAYKAARLAEGYAKASINRPLQLIKQAYGFALERNHLSRVPMINYLSEKGNVRKGFCEEPEESRRGRCPARRSDVHHRSQDRIDVQALQHRQPQTAAQWVGAGAGIS
jgi:hypothetical protein